MRNMEERKKYESQYLYMLKCICCYLVICIHFGKSVVGIFYELTRVAVPIFFIIQGRFLALPTSGKTIDECKKRNCKTEKKLVKMTCMVTMVYVVFSYIFFVICDGNSVEGWLQMKFAPMEWIRLFIFNTSGIIADTTLFFDHQWYLYAAIWCVTIVIVCQKRLNSIFYILAILPLGLQFIDLYGLHFLGAGIYFGSFYIKRIGLTRNFLCTGLPFMAIGMLIQQVAEQPVDGDRIRLRRNILLCGLLCGGILTYVEYFKSGEQELYLGSVMIAICVVAFGTVYGHPVPRAIVYIGKELSGYIFFWHPLLAALISRIVPVGMTPLQYTISVGLCSTILAIILERMKKLYERKRKTNN